MIQNLRFIWHNKTAAGGQTGGKGGSKEAASSGAAWLFRCHGAHTENMAVRLVSDGHVADYDSTRAGSKTSASGWANQFYCVIALPVLTMTVGVLGARRVRRDALTSPTVSLHCLYILFCCCDPPNCFENERVIWRVDQTTSSHSVGINWQTQSPETPRTLPCTQYWSYVFSSDPIFKC